MFTDWAYTLIKPSKTPGNIYVDIKTPSLHGNNSEFGAKMSF